MDRLLDTAPTLAMRSNPVVPEPDRPPAMWLKHPLPAFVHDGSKSPVLVARDSKSTLHPNPLHTSCLTLSAPPEGGHAEAAADEPRIASAVAPHVPASTRHVPNISFQANSTPATGCSTRVPGRWFVLTPAHVSHVVSEARAFAREWTELRALHRCRLYATPLVPPLDVHVDMLTSRAVQSGAFGTGNERHVRPELGTKLPAGAAVHSVSVRNRG